MKNQGSKNKQNKPPMFKTVQLHTFGSGSIRVDDVKSAVFVTEQGESWEIDISKHGSVGVRLVRKEDK